LEVHLFHIILISLFSIFIIANLFNLLKTYSSLKFLQKYYDLSNSSFPENLPDIIVVVPVLNEKRNIEKTIKYMFSFDYPQDKLNFLIITTEKEKIQKKKYDTIDIVNEISNIYKKVKWLHYPYTTGCKSDQLNFAIDNFQRLYPDKNPENTFFVIYDADSMPNLKTLKIFSLVFTRYKKANVFQQSAIFLKNFDEFEGKDWFSRYFLKIAALNQTKFTLAHEIPRIRRLKRSKYFIDKITYAHCVGHGLFIRVSFLKKLKFPENYYPEDLFYGFILNAIGEPIIPLPVLDHSDTPRTISDVFKQKASWFYGLLQINIYIRFVKEHFEYLYSKDFFRITLISTLLLFDVLRWLTASFFAILIVILTYFYGGIYIPLIFILIISYIYNYYLILMNYGILCEIAGKRRRHLMPRETFFTLLFSIIFVIFYSFPAYYGTTIFVLHALTPPK